MVVLLVCAVAAVAFTVVVVVVVDRSTGRERRGAAERPDVEGPDGLRPGGEG